MLSYILRRLALMIPTLIGMSLMLFVIVRFAPGLTSGGGEGSEGGKQGDRAAFEERMKKRLHLDKPLPVQYVMWLGDTLTGDFGESVQYKKPVLDLIKERLPLTFTLNLIASFLVYLIAIPGGMLASVNRGKAFDVGWSFFTLALYSLPVIWVGGSLLAFFGNPQYLGWFPVGGVHVANTDWMTSLQYGADYLWHLALPIICMTYGGFAYLSKIQRASLLDNLGHDYVRTARAKGLPPRVVMLRHVFRNSLIPMITIFSGILPGLLGGSVVVEKIFSLKGMGELVLTATLARDLPIVQGVAFIVSVIGLVSLLLADICYMVADPRVSYE